MKADELVLKISERLRKPLPGEIAQYAMAPHYRSRGSFSAINEAEYRHSAVLVLLCRWQNGKLFFPLTLRQQYNGPHSDQLSLPGGRYDESDGTLVNTAIRECQEEIGLREGISIVGQLTALHIPVSRYIVHPFVGFCDIYPIKYESQEREVKAVIEASVDELLQESCVQSSVFTTTSGPVEAPCFSFAGHQVWGATAMILSELKKVIEEAVQLR